MSPAEEGRRATEASNNARLRELFSEIQAAGLEPQLNEYLHIINRPYASYADRIEKRRKERTGWRAYFDAMQRTALPD